MQSPSLKPEECASAGITSIDGCFVLNSFQEMRAQTSALYVGWFILILQGPLQVHKEKVNQQRLM